MKTLRTIVILLVLFGLPAGSWYFLKFGFNWRKAKIESLTVKSHLLNDLTWDEKEKEELLSIMFYKTTVLKLGSGTEDDEQIIDQFKKAPTFQWMYLSANGDSIPQLSSKNVRKYFEAPDFFENNPNYSDVEYLLVDTALNIRQKYLESEESLGQLIEDIALVIPRQREKDIKLIQKK